MSFEELAKDVVAMIARASSTISERPSFVALEQAKAMAELFIISDLRSIESRIRAEIRSEIIDQITNESRKGVDITMPPLLPDIPTEPRFLVPRGGGEYIAPAKSGIYFIWKDSRIVYVGQSICLAERVRHYHPSIKKGESATWLLFPKSELNFSECFYIWAARPWRNFRDWKRQEEK